MLAPWLRQWLELSPVAAKVGSEEQHAWNVLSRLLPSTQTASSKMVTSIEKLLAKHSLTCVQVTRFADLEHLNTFKFHLGSNFAHKVFVNDSNMRLDRPTRGCSSGVLTQLRSDFPGIDTAAEILNLSVPGRYLVVTVTVQRAPAYIHNVYAPVDRHEKQSFF